MESDDDAVEGNSGVGSVSTAVPQFQRDCDRSSDENVPQIRSRRKRSRIG